MSTALAFWVKVEMSAAYCTLVSWSSVVRIGMPSALTMMSPCTPAPSGQSSAGTLDTAPQLAAPSLLRARVGAHALQRLLNLARRLRPRA